MRRSKIILVLFLFVFLGSCQPNQQLLYLAKDGFYYSPQFHFKAWFPHRPDIQTSTIKTQDNLEVELTSFMYNHDTRGFGLSVARYPEDMSFDTVAVLFGAERGLLKSYKAKEITHDLDTIPVHALTFSAAGKDVNIVGLLIFYQNYLYQLMVVDINQMPDTATVNKFIGNFALLKQD